MDVLEVFNIVIYGTEYKSGFVENVLKGNEKG